MTKLDLDDAVLNVKSKYSDIWIQATTGCGNARMDLYLNDAKAEQLIIMICNAKKKARKYKAKSVTNEI